MVKCSVGIYRSLVNSELSVVHVQAVPPTGALWSLRQVPALGAQQPTPTCLVPYKCGTEVEGDSDSRGELSLCSTWLIEWTCAESNCEYLPM